MTFKKFLTFLRLDIKTKLIVLWVIVTAVRIHRSLNRLGYYYTIEWLEQIWTPRLGFENTDFRGWGRLANVATALVVERDRSCLRCSLVLWLLLNKNGIEARLCQGLKMDEDLLNGHAWVEVDGKVINDRVSIAEHYKNITRANWPQSI